MMFGLGTDAVPPATGGGGTTTLPVPGFSEGLQLWTASPGLAITQVSSVLSNPTASFGAALLPHTLGILAVPIGIIAVVMSMSKKGGGL